MGVSLLFAACGGSSGHATSSTSSSSSTSSRSASTTASLGAGTTRGNTAHKRHSGHSRSRTSTDPSRSQTQKPGAAGAVPSGAVATVAGQPITLSAYQSAYAAQFKALASGQIPLDPPSFSRCAAAYGRLDRQLQAKLPKGAKARLPKTSHAQLVRDCRERYLGIKQSVLSQLIQQRWTLGAAKADGITVSAAQVNQALATQEKALGGTAAFDKYLKRSGQTRSGLLATTRLSLIEQALQKRRLGAPVHISQAQVAAFFKAHHAEFVLPHQKAPKLSTYAPRIRLLLQEQVQSRRAQTANLAYEHHWRSVTVCAGGYLVSLCSNGPA